MFFTLLKVMFFRKDPKFVAKKEPSKEVTE